MSVCNFNLTPERILVLTDTVAYMRDQPVSFGPKIAINAGAHAAVSTRGYSRVCDAVAEALTAPEVVDLPAAQAAVEDALRASWAAFEEAREGRSEATLFAWHGGPVALRFKMGTDGTMERFSYGQGTYLAPTLGAQQYPAILTPDQMFRIALVQQAVVKKHGLLMCVGGEAHLTEITAEGITFSVLGDYPDRAATEAEAVRNMEALIAEHRNKQTSQGHREAIAA